MMVDKTNFRLERIEKLLHELRYEVERGIVERDIDETIGFEFYVPISHVIPNGAVYCQFRTRPIQHIMMEPGIVEPRLRLVKGGKYAG
jgi:hypothetical protein